MNKFIVHSFILIICSVLGTSVQAQPNLLDIKLSGDYHWGEGIALEKNVAEELARQNLINRIVVLVTSEQSQTEQEIGTEYSSEFQSRSRATSRLQLRGLQYYSEQRRDRSWLVVAYIRKSTFDESLRIDEERILTKLNEADALRRQGNVRQAMPRYKEVYLASFFHPVPLYTDSSTHGRRTLVQGYAESHMTEWLRRLDIRVAGVRSRSTQDNTELYVDLQISDRSLPAEQLLVRVNRTGYGTHRVTSGAASVYLDQAPDTRVHALELEVRLNPAVLNDETLHELSREVGPAITRVVEVDYSEVVQLDMRVSSSRGNQVTITPVIANLSVFSLEWQLPGGEISRDPVLTYFHDASDAGEEIILMVNNSEELVARKMIGPDGQLRDVRPGTGRARVRPQAPPVSGTRPSPLPAAPPRTSGPDRQRPDNRGDAEGVIPSHSQYIQHIIRIRNAEQLTAHFAQLQSRDLLQFGQRSNVSEPDRSYLAIIDQRTREVITIVTPVQNGQRRNLRSNESFDASAIADEFRGYGAIWFQFN